MPHWCPACQDVIPTGASECPGCGQPVPWTSRLRRPGGRTLITIFVILAIGLFWLAIGVDRFRSYIDALVEALGGR